ncbi:serine hydrolase [Flavilitoribacter nigricans]|uniref:D-alanyl-D-alanine dipeptidase n=1 Tax=Flavilitoribacter nigricans (strain ATCC 23147 / DSM 23189 / NBRC 102662 / NCIMB 1420 / SS-2) TaxID=1122177 RepID=A0A2D0ND56_FLAN2|nr:serine hydrolase [Flavilitoribacter nigricans]PHN06109.1 serine hydrolase [Flavilitoribacter nigricans DSM 23189 = NBRC 102662]
MKFALNRITIITMLMAITLNGCRENGGTPTDPETYTAAIEKLTQAIQYEMEDKALPAVSMVLVDDQQTIWAQSFGMEDSAEEKAADLETVYRIGSVSKLFTDIAVMQLVERGEVDLDVPVQTYLPDFKPKNPYDQPITLRQLMSHRAGLIREPRVGHYFHGFTTTLEQTVSSLNGAPLIYEPETRVKYSNAGIAVVGYVLEKLKGQSFPLYMQQRIISPMGLMNSAFEDTPPIKAHLAVGEMWSYDGRRFAAPTFGLGMAPAGSMYATITDLGKFLSVLFNGGEGAHGRILKPATLEAMWEPQFESGGDRNYGLGFALDEQGGTRRVGHGGAIYGFATQLFALPDEKLGAAAVATADGANTITTRLADYALDLMQAAKAGEALPEYPTTELIPADWREKYEGHYQSGDKILSLEARGEDLFALTNGIEARLRKVGDQLVVNDRFAYGMRLSPQEDGSLTVGEERYTQITPAKPEPCPEKYRGLIGEYGWDHNVLFIYEEKGQLHALIEWFFKYPLEEIDENTFAFPEEGLYHGEQLKFTRNDAGIAELVEIPHSVGFPRRQHIQAAETFQIEPLLGSAELRKMALAARPPEETDPKTESDLVELTDLDPSIKLDIRYAGTNNFMGTTFYRQARAFMQRPAAEALVRAHQKLQEQGYGLLIYDAYRPWYVTKMFWEATPEDKKIFVADPEKGSRHNRGCAVDLTLYDLKTGEVITMLAGYDEMTERSYPFYVGGTDLQRWHRELLRETMEAEGFSVYDFEWWHFDYGAWRDYPIMNVQFEQLQ